MPTYRFLRRAACAAVAAICCAAIPAPAVRALPAISPVLLDQDRFLLDYELTTIDPAETFRRVQHTGRVEIAAGLDRFDLELTPNDLRAPGYRAVETLADGSTRRLPAEPVKTYAGRVRGSNAQARFTIDEGRFSGMIIDDDPIFVEPLSSFSLAGGPTDYVVYRASDVRPDAVPGTCGLTEAEKVGDALQGVADKAAAVALPGVSTVQIATETDNEYVGQFGSAAAANSEILSIVNQIDGIYESQVGLSFQVVLQNTYAGADPYTSNNNASTMLSELRTYWNANRGNVVRDLVHMWTGKDMAGSTVGIAYVGVICNAASYSYGISQRYTSSPQKYVLTAHEIGHNFNACHSDTSCNPSPSSCNSTIMQSFVGTGFTFCTFSRSQITAHATANASCLTSGGGGTPTVPAAPTNLTATATSRSRIQLAWVDNSTNETGFRIERSTNGVNFTEIGTVGANVTAVGNINLQRNRLYYYRIRAYNSVGNSGYSNTASARTFP
jgi:hypothetical protein